LEFLGEEVDGALTAQNIRGETLVHPNSIASARALHVNSKQSKSGRKDKYTGDPFCVFCESEGHCAQRMQGDGGERSQRKAQISISLLSLLESRPQRKSLQQEGLSLMHEMQRAHHRSICNETGAITTPTKDTAPTTVGKIDVASRGFTYLQTARIWLMGPTGLSKLTRCVGRRQSVKFCR